MARREIPTRLIWHGPSGQSGVYGYALSANTKVRQSQVIDRDALRQNFGQPVTSGTAYAGPQPEVHVAPAYGICKRRL